MIYSLVYTIIIILSCCLLWIFLWKLIGDDLPLIKEVLGITEKKKKYIPKYEYRMKLPHANDLYN